MATPGMEQVSGRPGSVPTDGCMWWGSQGWRESQEHQSPWVRAPGRWGSAPLCPGNAPQSRSRWEASGSPHLAVIHAGCAGAFTAHGCQTQRGVLEVLGFRTCACLLRGKPRLRTASATASPPPWQTWPPALSLEGVGLRLGTPLACRPGDSPASCAVWPVTRARPLLQDQAGPAPLLPSARP